MNLLEEGIDVGIRISALEDSSLVAQPLGSIRRVVVASPAFLRAHGAPRHPRELLEANCVRIHPGAPAHWTFRENGRPLAVAARGNLEFNHIAPAVEACAAGMGFGMFFSYQVLPLVRAGPAAHRAGRLRAAAAAGERDLPACAAAAGAHAGLHRLDEDGIRRASTSETAGPQPLRHNARGASPPPLFSKPATCASATATTTVVDDLSFEIAPGECLGVIGPNGAGKTTTIRMCLGLTAPDGGAIEALGGLSMPRDARAIKAQLGVVSQFDTLDPDFSCAENLMVYAPLLRHEPRARSRRAFRSCWSSRRCRTRPTPGRASCPAACGGGCRWRARWSTTRSC